MRASADTFSKEEHHIIVDNALRASCASTFWEEQDVLLRKCVKVATMSTGALAPALSASVNTFGDDKVRDDPSAPHQDDTAH